MGRPAIENHLGDPFVGVQMEADARSAGPQEFDDLKGCGLFSDEMKRFGKR